MTKDAWIDKYIKILDRMRWEIEKYGGVRSSTKHKMRSYLDELPEAVEEWDLPSSHIYEREKRKEDF